MRLSKLRPHAPSRRNLAVVAGLLVILYLLTLATGPEPTFTSDEQSTASTSDEQSNASGEGTAQGSAPAPAGAPGGDRTQDRLASSSSAAGRKDVTPALADAGARRNAAPARVSRAAAKRRSIFSRLLAPGRFAYHEIVRQAAERYRVEHRLIMAIIASESGGNPDALSPAGAIGLMQLMPETAERLGVDPWDPEQNIDGAVRYLAKQLATFKSVDLSLVAYNAGPGFAEKYRRGHVELGAETRGFLTRVGQLLQ